MVYLLLLGFSSGVPAALTATTLQAWMASQGVDLGTIGLFALIGTPYALKFLWAPVMDRFVPPFLGRRRGWLLVTQLALAVSIAVLGMSDPVGHLRALACIALLTAFLSASQDIVADAYRTDLLAGDREGEAGLGSAIHVTGYRIAMIFSSSVALILSDHLPWRVVYLLMAASMGVGVVATWLAPEPSMPARPPRTLSEAVVQPFLEFFKRTGAIEVVLFTLLYKLDAVLTIALQTPFMLKMGFSRTDIGVVTKGFGLTATIVGTLAGGALMVRLGLKRSLWIFGFTQAFAGLSFMALAMAGHSWPWMTTAVITESACSGMGNAAYAAFLMSQCDRRFSATQYALLSSLMSVTRNVLSAPAGFLVGSLGWVGYYVLCVFISAPAFLLLLRYDRWLTARSV